MDYKRLVGYQIYPKSFCSDGKSVGTINGIRSKLDYLADLGVNLLWLCPIFDSPMDDNGYDIRDYYKINELYGSIEDVKLLIEEAHKRDIKIIFDLVLNHTSDEHVWFKKSREKDPYYDDFYIWTKEKYNWGSFFGGSAFEYDEVRGEYFLHLFSKKMPDLNYKSVNLRNEIKKMMSYYLDLGIDGFRLDAISHIWKKKLENTSPVDKELVYDFKLFSNLSEVHDVLKELNKDVFSKHDIFTIGEIGGDPTVDEAISYTFNELDMFYTFDFTNCAYYDVVNRGKNKINVNYLRDLINKYQYKLNEHGWMGLYLTNHDIERAMSLYGDNEYFIESGSMMACLMYLLRGTPFIYNGEEIGMTNYDFKKVSDFDDVRIRTEWELNINSDKPLSESDFVNKVKFYSRDNARTIMQWDDSLYGGFSDVLPWFHVNPNKSVINVKDELRSDKSLLKEYKKIIKIRKSYDDIIEGEYKSIYLNDNLISYKRGNIIIICNCVREKVSIDLSEFNIDYVIYNNYDKLDNQLEAYQAVVLMEK